MLSPRPIAIALAALCLPFAACGGGDEASKADQDLAASFQTASAPAPPPDKPGQGQGQQAVANCVNAEGAASGLKAEAGQRLVVGGVDDSTYDVVAVHDAGQTISQQVMVFASMDAREASVAAVDELFSDVRAAGNTLVVRRGGDQASTLLVLDCALLG